MLENISEITSADLIAVTQQMQLEGYRFITASCVCSGDDAFDMIYHFDRDMVLRQYRFTVRNDETVPSISSIYFCALLVENEMKELFGINIDGIVIDYGGKMLLADGAPSTPMAGGQITIVQQ